MKMSRDTQSSWCKALIRAGVFSFCVVLFEAACIAQVVDTNDENWVYRYDIFQAFLQREGLAPTSSLADALKTPENATIVLIGDVRRETVGSWIKLKEFVDSGGRVLIAPDNFHSTVYFGETQPGPIIARTDQSMFSGFDDCVRITRFRSTHPLVSDLKELVTNRTGGIRRIGVVGDWMQLAFLPDDCSPDEFAGKSILGVGETEAKGSIVLLADPSVLSNGMFSFADNGEFAGRLSAYLSDSGRRILFMAVDNRPLRRLPGVNAPNFDPSAAEAEGDSSTDDAESVEPQFQTLLEVANSAIKELANSEDLNSRLSNQPRNINKRQYVIFIITAVTLILLTWTVFKLLGRSNPWLRYRRSTGGITAEAMLRNGFPSDIKNRIASEILAREFCRQWTGESSLGAWRQWLEDLKHHDRDALPVKDRVDLESLLAIAVFGGKTPMPDQELSKLSQQICDLLQRYRQDGKLIR